MMIIRESPPEIYYAQGQGGERVIIFGALDIRFCIVKFGIDLKIGLTDSLSKQVKPVW